MRPTDRRYRQSHEWALREGDLVVVGITDHAIAELTDLVYLGLPEKGTQLTAGDEFGEIESVKAVSALYAPVSGEVVDVNIALIDDLDAMKQDAYRAGWLIKIRPSSPTEYDALLDATTYDAQVAH
jgi:glycine cleavage system H protein